MRRSRKRHVSAAQLSLFGENTRASLRSRALAAINASSTWMSAQQVAKTTGLTYRQTIDALNALHNAAQIARLGRKFTAKWGSLALIKPDPAIAAAHRLEDVFRGFKR